MECLFHRVDVIPDSAHVTLDSAYITLHCIHAISDRTHVVADLQLQAQLHSAEQKPRTTVAILGSAGAFQGVFLRDLTNGAAHPARHPRFQCKTSFELFTSFNALIWIPLSSPNTVAKRHVVHAPTELVMIRKKDGLQVRIGAPQTT